MKRSRRFLTSFLLTSVVLFVVCGAFAATPQWGQWRGPDASGLREASKPPLKWSEEKNIRWKVALPGHGLSTPIIAGDLIFLQTAISTNPKSAEAGEAEAEREGGRDGNREGRRRGGGPGGEGREGRRRGGPDNPGGDDARGREGRRERGGPGGPGGRGGRGGRGRGMRNEVPTDMHHFDVLAIDRKTGKTVWQRTVRKEVPHEGSHRDGSLAPASPVTDGEHVYAHFGSRGLYCLTLEGDVVWEKDLGDMKTRAGFGEGSSPALHGDTVVVNWDHEGESFIVALDSKTGEEKWRRPREEGTSWTTPVIIEDGGSAQVVVSATNRIRSYDLASGEVVWECGGLGSSCAATPVLAGDLLIAMSGHRNPAALAIRHRGAKGDLTDTPAVAWKLDKGTPYVPSPLFYGDTLYFLQKNSGILSCVNPMTGESYYGQSRLDELNTVYASPVGADGRVYIAGRNGVTYVLKRGQSFEVLAVNKLDDEFSASPAIVGDELFLRGRKNLYCIAGK